MQRTMYTVEFNNIDDIPYDPNASIPKDSRVEKINAEIDQLHGNGTIGITKGCVISKGEEYYLVQFDNQRINKDNIINMSSSPDPEEILIQISGKYLKQIK